MNNNIDILNYVMMMDRVSYWYECTGVEGIGIGFISDSPSLAIKIITNQDFRREYCEIAPSIKFNYDGLTYYANVEVVESK